MNHHRSIFIAALCALALTLSACDRRSGDAASGGATQPGTATTPGGSMSPPASAASR